MTKYFCDMVLTNVTHPVLLSPRAISKRWPETQRHHSFAFHENDERFRVEGISSKCTAHSMDFSILSFSFCRKFTFNVYFINIWIQLKCCPTSLASIPFCDYIRKTRWDTTRACGCATVSLSLVPSLSFCLSMCTAACVGKLAGWCGCCLCNAFQYYLIRLPVRWCHFFFPHSICDLWKPFNVCLRRPLFVTFMHSPNRERRECERKRPEHRLIVVAVVVVATCMRFTYLHEAALIRAIVVQRSLLEYLYVCTCE